MKSLNFRWIAHPMDILTFSRGHWRQPGTVVRAQFSPTGILDNRKILADFGQCERATALD
jgi:hypothetical protein